MNTTPITPTSPACYGVLCQQRKGCQRYALIEQTSTDQTVATCDNGMGDKPLFVAVEKHQQEQQR